MNPHMLFVPQRFPWQACSHGRHLRPNPRRLCQAKPRKPPATTSRKKRQMQCGAMEALQLRANWAYIWPPTAHRNMLNVAGTSFMARTAPNLKDCYPLSCPVRSKVVDFTIASSPGQFCRPKMRAVDVKLLKPVNNTVAQCM